MAQPQQVGFGFQKLGLRRFLWQIKRAFRTCHPVRALVEEVICTVAVSKIIELPRLGGGSAIPNRFLVNEHFDRSQIASEIAGVCIRLGELGRSSFYIMLSRFWRAVAQPLLEFKQSHRLFGIE